MPFVRGRIFRERCASPETEMDLVPTATRSLAGFHTDEEQTTRRGPC